MQKKIKLTTARLRLLLHCNLRCIMCDRWARASKQNVQSSKNFYLPREKISELYKDFKSLGVKRIRLTGGEPTLRKDLLSIVEEGRKKFGFNIELSTNGFCLTKDYVEALLASGLGGIILSLDSANSVEHDAMRGVEGSFKKACETLNYVDNRIPAKIISLITKLNYRNLDKMVILAKNLGVKDLSFQQVVGERPRRTIGLNKKELIFFFNKIVPKIMRSSLKFNITSQLYPFLGGLMKKSERNIILELTKNIQKFDKELEAYSRGFFGRFYFSRNKCQRCLCETQIKEDGKVIPCCVLNYGSGAIMGDIYENTFLEIWNSEKYKTFRAKTGFKNKYCIHCPYVQWV